MATRIRKIARATLKGLGVLLLVVIAALALILTTNAGLRLALRIGLPIYNDMIAGSVAIEAAEGTLLSSFTLRGVILADRDGRALITADAVAIDWTPRRLFARDLQIDSLTLEHPQVYLPGIGSSFGDIAPPGDDVPKDMSLPPGPDLPLAIAATLRLRDGAVFMADGAPIVEAVDLDLRARGAGRVAEAELLAGRGRLLGQLEIEALTLRAGWAAPVAMVDALRVELDTAVLEIPQARLDVREWRGLLDLRARAALAGLADYLPAGTVEKLMAPAGTLELAVAGEGDPEDLAAEVRVALAPGIALRLAGTGAWRGTPQADVTLTTDVDLAPWTAARLGRVRPTIELHARQLASKKIGLAGGLRCPECARLGGVSLDVEGIVAEGGLALETALDAAGIGALVDVVAMNGSLRRVDWRLSVVDVARPAAVARQFVKVPDLQGSLRGRGACVGPELRCAGALELRRLNAAGVEAADARIDVDVLKNMSEGTLALAVDGLRAGGQVIDRGELRLDVEKLPAGPVAPPVPAALPPLHAQLRAGVRGPGSRADIDLSVRTGQEIGAELRKLDADHAGFHAELEQPARAVLSGTRLQVDDLALQIAGGRLAAKGVVDADGPSDLNVDLSGLALTRLRPLLPRSLRPAGTASAHVRVHGRPEAPAVEADVKVARAGLRGGTLGDIEVAAKLNDGRAEVDAELRGPLARQLRLLAEAPVRVDMSQRTGSIGQGGYTKVELRVQEARLARLRPWLARPDITGKVDGMVLLEAGGSDGPLASPRVLTEWRARELVINDAPVGDVAVSASHRGEWLQGKVDLHRSGGRAQLDVQVPLDLDPLRGRFAWHREREHRVLLQLDEIDLAKQLDALAPGHDAAGKLTLRAELTGPASAPALQAELRGEGLMHRRIALGSVSLVAHMRDGGAALDLSGGGGQVGRFQVRALAPVAVDASGVRWRRDGWYALNLDLRELELAPLEPMLGLNLGGRITGGVTFDGAGRHPKLLGSVRADRLSFKDQPVGNLRVDVDFRDGKAKLAGQGRLGKNTRIALDGRVPFDVDLTTGKVEWATERPGKVRLDVTGLDHDALEPFSPLPQQALIALNVHAEADVDAEHVRGKAAIAGEIGHKVLGGLPLKVELAVDDAAQTLRGSLGRRNEKGSLTFSADATASVPKLRRGQAKLLATPIRGDIKARATDLRYLSGFFPEAIYDFTGFFSSEVAVRGELGKPTFRGAARLQKGGVTVVALQQRFRDLNFQIDADGPRLTLTSLTATSGEGRLRATGAATFASGGKLNAEASLALSKFPVVRPGLPQMIVDTKVHANMKRSPQGLGVAIDVDGAEVWVSDLTTRAPDPLPENEHVKIVTGPLPELQAALGSQVGATDTVPPVVVAEEKTMPPTKDAVDLEQVDTSHMDLEVRLQQPVHIKGPSMDMSWSGTLALHRKGEAAEVTGGFRSDRGRFELLGNRFTIDQGRVFLPEDGSTIDPYLDLTADTTTPQAEVTVAIRGRLSRPELKLRSRPSLTEGQIFALLLTGTADTQESDPKKTQASAAGLLVNFSNPTLSRFADQKLGIDRIKFGFADDVTQPVLSVGKHLTKKIYAETSYHHNAPARQNRIQGSFEYRFRPSWSVETFFGDAAVGGLDLFWRRSFGRTRARGEQTPEPAEHSAPGSAKPTASR